jgi:hypothetical protein
MVGGLWEGTWGGNRVENRVENKVENRAENRVENDVDELLCMRISVLSPRTIIAGTSEVIIIIELPCCITEPYSCTYRRPNQSVKELNSHHRRTQKKHARKTRW